MLDLNSRLENKIGGRVPLGLGIVLAAFVAFAVFYSVIIPLFEGPDEDDHFRYAKFIADHRAFPIQQFEPGGGIAGHQGWQPPLYYTLAALVIAPLDTSDYEQHLWRNYAATFLGDPACCGRNLYYHTDAENFPYTRTTLAVHLVRLLSVLFGAVTVAAVYALTKTMLPEHTLVALAAASVVAFNPSFLFASALVSNDTALAALCALILLAWVKLLHGQLAPAEKSAGVISALIGTALLIKTTALGLIPFSMLVVIVVAWRKRAWRFAIIGNAAMVAVAALIAGGWFARNTLLYGDPLAYRLLTTSAIFPRSGPLTFEELTQISLPWLWQTFWGGPTPGDFAPTLLVALVILTAFALIGMFAFAIRNSQSAIRVSLFFLAAWLGFILTAQIQFIQTTVGADQGRYLFPAIATIASFFAIGLVTLLGRTTHDAQRKNSVIRLSSSVIAFGFFGLALFVPFAYTLPAYAHPPLLSENDLAHTANPTQIVFANQIELRGFDLDTRTIKPGDALRVTLDWRARAPMPESYRVFVHLIGQDDISAGGADVIPGRGAFPTVYWKPGDTFRDVVRIPVASNATPGKYAVEVGLYPVGRPGDRLSVVGSGDDRALIDAIKILPNQPVSFNPQNSIGANFGNTIELRGYDANNSQLTFYWRARKNVGEEYAVFVHALDANGKIVTQKDQLPQAGNNPTSMWIAGEEIRDDYRLDLPPGEYRIAVGLYRPDTGARLPIGESDHIEFSLTVK